MFALSLLRVLFVGLFSIVVQESTGPEEGEKLQRAYSTEGLSDPILRAVKHDARSPLDLARDPARKPGHVLEFFGIKPGMKVGDLMAGDGYYTELVSYVVGDKGKVWAQNNKISLRNFAQRPLTNRLKKPTLKNVVRLDRPLEDPGFPKGELDAVIMIRFYHDSYWMNADRKVMNAQVLASLKPGGVFGIIDHHASEGSEDRDVQTLHRVDAELVQGEILDAGFEFVKESDLLQNKEDSRDWNIFKERGKFRDKTDRFIFLFRKPE